MGGQDSASTSQPSREAFDVDGPRSAVAPAIEAANRWRLSDAERLVLLVLALDSYDGETSAPGYDGLCVATGLYRGRVMAAVRSLLSPVPDRRPALLGRRGGTGRGRTVFELLFTDPDIHRSGSPTGRAPRPTEARSRSGYRSGSRSGSPTHSLPYPPMADVAGNGSGGARAGEPSQLPTAPAPSDTTDPAAKPRPRFEIR